MSTVLLQLKDIIVLHDLKVPPHFFLLARSMVTIEGVIHHLYPDLDLLELARPYLIKTFKRKFDPIKLGTKILNGIYQLGAYMEDFPQDLKNAINRINQGNVKVDLTHKGIDPMVHTVNRVSKQVVTSLIIAGLFVASSLFIIHKVEPFWKGFSVLGISGMALSVFLTYGMLRDLRKGDHDDWKGWDED
jgi:ubiquinone biosynthesis protein